ncbi:hypothetical protein AB0O91_40700 [Kitasatospora sp. NPDC089797]|uniref:hypothetical protein n=1 Tax=Kitasatospora sp. NPDC089797 TaxID=3155298 RepID=UPI0034405AA0
MSAPHNGHPSAPHDGRPGWFTGSDEKLTLLRRVAGARGVVLDPDTPPAEADAEELTDGLADVLLTEHCFDADWETTPYGDLVESLIDALNPYAYPD